MSFRVLVRPILPPLGREDMHIEAIPIQGVCLGSSPPGRGEAIARPGGGPAAVIAA